MIKHPKPEIWEHEHGPGGEINIVKKGANYGWPVATYGIDYDDTIISNHNKRRHPRS
jgi:glucose/arabinose dehydrogenase